MSQRSDRMEKLANDMLTSACECFDVFEENGIRRLILNAVVAVGKASAAVAERDRAARHRQPIELPLRTLAANEVASLASRWEDNDPVAADCLRPVAVALVSGGADDLADAIRRHLVERTAADPPKPFRVA